jgi:hypothetical protein
MQKRRDPGTDEPRNLSRSMAYVLNPHARSPARALGLAGLIPFVGLTVAMHAGHWPQGLVALAQLAYGATIVSFIGALHWGLAMRDPTLNRSALWRALGWGVMPSLLAWLALLAPLETGLWMLCATVPACWWMDARLSGTLALERWYMQLRTLLSAVVTVCLGASALALR